jgi:drug/metabolite transporter (DMT)-like permease
MGILYGFASVFFMSTMPVINKFILQTTSPILGALVNSVVATVFFFAVALVTTKSIRIPFSKFSLTSGVFNGLGLIFLFMALEQIHPAIYGFLGRLSVIYAMILSAIFLKEKPDRAEIILGILAVGGALGSAIEDGNHLNLPGVLLAVASTLSFSAANLCLKFASNKNSNTHALAAMNLVSVILLTCFFAISSEHLRIPSAPFTWGLMILGALFGSCFGFWFYLQSIKMLTYSRANLLRATNPLFTAIVAYPFFGLNFSLMQIVSALILMVSIIAISIHERNKKAQNG